MQTDREVTASRTDMIIKNKQRGNMHTDRFGDTRGQKCCVKEAEKELKYRSACKEIQRMGELKCVITPAVIGATEIVTKR